MRTEKTYAWIIETENSRINRIVCLKIINIIKAWELISLPESPKRVRSKWPAIIFAVNRIDKVKGRITILIDSIITINGMRMGGVPIGIKWAIVSLKKFVNL